MNSQRDRRAVDGVVLLDKPAGMTSNRALQAVRSLFKARKAGHTGSLDPFATGMLPCCLGEASKTAGFMLEADKRYRAEACLGTATATGDVEGETVRTAEVPRLAEGAVRTVLRTFVGTQQQVPPMYSALKHQGRPLYELARAGQEVERQPREVSIHELTLRRWASPRLEFEVSCSKGTYIRTLAEDIAAALGTCGHLRALRRLAVGGFREEDMVSLDALEHAAAAGCLERFLLPVDAGLSHWPILELEDDLAVRFRHGNPVPFDGSEAGPARVYDRRGQLLGLGELDERGLLRPRRVFAWC